MALFVVEIDPKVQTNSILLSTNVGKPFLCDKELIVAVVDPLLLL